MGPPALPAVLSLLPLLSFSPGNTDPVLELSTLLFELLALEPPGFAGGCARLTGMAMADVVGALVTES